MAGQLGLNTIPSARMDESGTVRIGIGTVDPYIHGFIGFQIAEPLYVSLRQTSESSDLLGDPDRLYPGVDFKLRLAEEGRYWPEISVGVQSAVGHKRMGGEYLVASKRYNNFDFTGGIGWGRFGSAGHFKNPLSYLHNHFDGRRDNDGESPIEPNDWFTGDDIGLFAGIEYFTPLDGLSVKADWGADRHEAERAAFDFGNTAPWSIAMNYAPQNWVDFSIGMQGTEKVMARMSFQNDIENWPRRGYKKSQATPLKPDRTDIVNALDIERNARNEDLYLLNAVYEDTNTHANIRLDENKPTALQIGRAARHMANDSPKNTESLSIGLSHRGLRGPSVTLIRRDLETALLNTQGSPQEIWRNASIDNQSDHDVISSYTDKKWNLRLILDNDVSLSEEDTGVIYRTAILADEVRDVHTNFLGGHLTAGAQVRFNIRDNLHRIRDFRPRSTLPVRSDVNLFTDETFSLDRSYMSWFKTIDTDIHTSLSFGLLEEMYAGFGGEILYRPFGKTYGFGAEAWQAFKRDPTQKFNLGLNGDRILSGHLNAFYEVPNATLTVHAQIGRYLAEDIGATIALEKRFNNGSKIKGFVTTTDKADFDVFGSQTHLYSGLNFSVPIGNVKYLGKGSEIRLNATPLGRDSGQKIDKPVSLYDVTEPLSYRGITQHWTEILN
ncbi:MAG: YjbH domain-containing protein [Pseudomonadota bacterium]